MNDFNINTYEKEHKSYKILVIVSVIIMALVVSAVLVSNHMLIERFTNTTWVAVEGQIYKVKLEQDFNYPERIHERILAAKMFYNYRYTGNKNNQDSNIKNALTLCGDCSESVLHSYEDEMMRKNILEKGYTYQTAVDSVVMISDFEGFIFGKQTIRTRSKDIVRNMHIQFMTRDLIRREKANLLAVEIDKVEIFNNEILNDKYR